MLTDLKLKIAAPLQEFWRQEKTETSEIIVARITKLFEKPKSSDHGHFSLPVFSLAKIQKKAPPIIAKEIAEHLSAQELPEIQEVLAVSGFVNIKIKKDYLLKTVFSAVKSEGLSIGQSQVGAGKKVVIDYSSPNVAKPMHIGHLRATVIGQALKNLAESQGYEVQGLNHLGDWGSQFGKLCYAYERWASEFPFDKEPFESLYKLYVKFHTEVEKEPEIENVGASYFKKLEDGDPDIVALWKQFIEISLADFNKQWDRLGSRHEITLGESFYNDKLSDVEKRLKEKSLLVEDEGAQVVRLDELNIPPCLIRKKDGASLYATRDLASAIYRHDNLKADINLYVVGSEQKLHFQQVFAVLEKMGFEWASHCHHISFGLIHFKGMGKISSRKGNIIRFSDVIDEAVNRVKEKMADRLNSDEDIKAQANTIAEQVATGALVFNDLKNERVRDVDFDWDQALSFDGDSGPYLQYVYVRCNSLIEKYGQEIGLHLQEAELHEEEADLAFHLSDFETVLAQSFTSFKPNLLANYLVQLSTLFNRFYHKHRILDGETEQVQNRMALVRCSQTVLGKGLDILGVPKPQKM